MLAHAYYLTYLSQDNRAYSTLTRQLEAVINEVFTVQVLKLRTNQWQTHEAKYFPPTKVTYSHTGIYNGQASYFDMKALVLYLEGNECFLNHAKSHV